MINIDGNVKHKRKPVDAAALSLLLTGLGHIYCGKLARGLFFAFLSWILGFLFVLFLMYYSSIQAGISRALIVIGLFAVPIIAAIDAYCIARRIKGDYELKEYNRWYVYVLLALITCSSTVGSSFYVRSQLYQPFYIPTCHSYPTIAPGDRILASKIAYTKEDPAIGDVIVFRNPENMRQKQIKRIVAVAGDMVEIKTDQLFINGRQLPREKVDQPISDQASAKMQGDVFCEINGEAQYKIILAPLQEETKISVTDFAPITVPQHYCFVLGDNRHFSRDSRHYGPVPLASIIGRADYLYWPAKGWSRFGRINQ